MPVSRDGEAEARPRSRCRAVVGTRRATTTSPRSVNLMALPTRLTSTWRSRPASPTSASGTSGVDVADQLQALRVGPHGQGPQGVADRVRAGENSAGSSSSLPASILEKSSMSLMIAEQAVGRRLDRLEILRCSCAEGGVQGQLGHAEDRVHRRADLVADVGQELVLGPVGRLGRLLRPAQFRLRAACARRCPRRSRSCRRAARRVALERDGDVTQTSEPSLRMYALLQRVAGQTRPG